MYPVGDEDLMQLEAYLDDALSDEEVAMLRDRLAHETALSTALKMLREERTQRQAFFASIDPTPAEVDKLVGQIKHKAQRRRWYHHPRKVLQTLGAMAACVVVGAILGQVYNNNPGGVPRPHGTVGISETKTNGQQKYAVEVTDDFGNVIAVQEFTDQQAARDFMNDLKKVQSQRRQRNGVINVGDEF
jgi:hypothetical protein